MFTFLIPLVGRTPRVSWERVSDLLGATLRSIFAQTDPEFRVLIAGQDRPDLPELNDPRVSFLPVDFALPTGTEVERNDKYDKIRRLIEEGIHRGADALAVVDADDRVSRRIVAYFRASPHPTGYVYDQGYVWDYASGCLATAEDTFGRPLHQRCGTCSIIALSEARNRFGDDIEGLVGYAREFVHHTEIAERGARQKRPFAILPFPGAIYVLNHGDGLGYRRGWDARAMDKRHAKIRRFRIDVTPEMREEFTLAEAFEPGVVRRWRLPTWPDRMLRSARIWTRKVRGKQRPA